MRRARARGVSVVGEAVGKELCVVCRRCCERGFPRDGDEMRVLFLLLLLLLHLQFSVVRYCPTVDLDGTHTQRSRPTGFRTDIHDANVRVRGHCFSRLLTRCPMAVVCVFFWFCEKKNIEKNSTTTLVFAGFFIYLFRGKGRVKVLFCFFFFWHSVVVYYTERAPPVHTSSRTRVRCCCCCC